MSKIVYAKTSYRVEGLGVGVQGVGYLPMKMRE